MNRFPEGIWPVAGESETRVFDLSEVRPTDAVGDPLLPVAHFGPREEACAAALRSAFAHDEDVAALALQVQLSFHTGMPRPEKTETLSARWIELNYVVLFELLDGVDVADFTTRRLMPVVSAVQLGRRHYLEPKLVDAALIEGLDPETAARIR